MKIQHTSLYLCIALLISFFPVSVSAQQHTSGIDVEDPQSVKSQGVEFSIELDKPDWLYKLGDEPVFKFDIRVNNEPIEVGEVTYRIGPEKMHAIESGKVTLKNGRAEISAQTMDEPGFLRCEAAFDWEGQAYKAVATAAFSSDQIKPYTVDPIDFDSYWSDAVENSKSIPLNMVLTPMSNRSNDSVVVYQVKYEFYNDSVQQFYGVLSMPIADGKYPAIIRFPGAGWAPLAGDQNNAADGFITLDLYIHGHPVIYDRAYYVDLQHNALKAYQYRGVEDRDSFYYKNVLLGCVRAVDLIHALPKFDGHNIGAWGSSQGGALSIMTTALEKRIDYLVALCPAMADFPGYLHGRAGGWPHFFTQPELYEDKTAQVVETLSYFDVVNFAKRISVPGFYSWGFNDPTTPPTSIYAAYNSIQAPRELFVIPDGVHKIYPEQRVKTYAWLKNNLKRNEKR